ncbi:YbhB/YbcL family Raf kinase inhibitor-like protein [Streptomyces sp. NPDC058683]|uniref:YbhB/YbcL family Raf kinase inhibitor-like protein n=1 Tax=Streptomyces sp. NPDC058683 TaxID=3346597 RepID=UPI00366912B0
MRKTTRAAAALAAVAAVTTGVTTANADTGAAHDRGHTAARSASAHDGGYGYSRVRKGVPDSAARFAVSSPDVRDGGTFPADAYADSFGCSSGNRQIRLAWHGAPQGTRSYAVTLYDPDAPTGAGFWHWLTWDIPTTDTALGGTLPTGAVAGTNDAGQTGYLGPCPPVGDIAHHYRITVYALDTPSLDLPATTPATVTTFTMSSHVIGYATLTASARR